VDTYQDSPGDILEPPDQPPVRDGLFAMQPRSVVVFERRKG
jgi:hypothetical protein